MLSSWKCSSKANYFKSLVYGCLRMKFCDDPLLWMLCRLKFRFIHAANGLWLNLI